MSRVFSFLAVALAAFCLLGSLSIHTTGLSAHVMVVTFWLAFFCSLAALLCVRRKRLMPLAAVICAWALLCPVIESVMAWSAWWLNSFGP